MTDIFFVIFFLIGEVTQDQGTPVYYNTTLDTFDILLDFKRIIIFHEM